MTPAPVPAPDLEIRPIRSEEFAAVSTLAVEAYGGDYDLPADYLSEIGDVAGRAQSAAVWVAELGGELVGTVTVPRPGERLQDDTLADEMDLRLLAVSGRARGRGVAEALVRHCLELARARGSRRLVLHTASMMHGARRLYERMGFERISEREFEFASERSGETLRLMVYGFTLER